VRAGVAEDVARYGMKVVIDDKMPRDLNDISATLTKVRALKPDILVISGHTKGAVTAGRQIMEMKIQVPMIGLTHCESGKIIEKYGSAVDGILCPTQWAETMSYEGKYFGTAQNYYDEYSEAYGAAPPYQAAQASAAVLVWKDAFERAGSFDTDKLRAALYATDMKTFYGDIRFSKAGNNVAKPMALRQIQDGKLHVVAPSKFAAKPVIHPRQAMY
jgi:branched-chain amino acid transport system substrate-binding protein